MATQLAEPLPDPGGTMQPPPNDNAVAADAAPERDWDAEARAQGWTDREAFKGDPNRWIDAETFVRRADEVLPLVKKQNEHLKREIQDLKRLVKRVQKSEQAAYENALADIEARQEKAVESGNVAEHRRLKDEADKLRKGMAQDAAPPSDQQREAIRAFAEWRDQNEWYDLGGLPSATAEDARRRAYFDRMVEANQERTSEMEPADFISFIGDLVEAKFPPQRAARPKGQESVAGVTRGAQGRGAKTGANLPQDAKDAVRRYMRQNIYPGKSFEEACNEFAKSYDWGDA